MKEKVYLDSTIPSYYFDQRESLASYIEGTSGVRPAQVIDMAIECFNKMADNQA
jgi:hypothetical protein